VAFRVATLEDSNHLREHFKMLYLFMPRTDIGTVEVLLHSLTSALDAGKRSTWSCGKFTRGKKPSTTEQEAEWTLEPVCMMSRSEKSLTPAGIRAS
jgi:hypothetical protein